MIASAIKFSGYIAFYSFFKYVTVATRPLGVLAGRSDTLGMPAAKLGAVRSLLQVMTDDDEPRASASVLPPWPRGTACFYPVPPEAELANGSFHLF